MPAALKYQRTEYAKKIRKDYESGKIKERRCNMREYTLRTDGLCNTITTVTKDNLVVEKHNPTWLEKKYTEFYEKHGYIPECFEPYNCREITDYAPTLTAHSNCGSTFAGTTLVIEVDKENGS